MSSASQATAGIRNTATCAAEASAISAASLTLPAARHDDGAAVLGGVPDDRDDHGRDEELGETDLLGEHLERADEDLGNERGDDGREPSTRRAA